VEVFCRDGRQLSKTVSLPHGSAESPLSWQELVEKYEDCAARVLAPDAAGQALSLLAGIEGLADVRELTACLSLPAR
jgi:hypothetical protein